MPETSDNSKGAAGRPLLSNLIETTLANMAPPTQPPAPTLRLNGLTSIPESASSSSSSTDTPSDRSKLRLNMLRKIRPPPFRHAWTFYHEKVAVTTDAAVPYEERLTTMLEDIITIKTFWELLNQFPLQNLRTKDSIHFFKRSVRPVWEDPRNVEGGAWTFRVHKDVSGEFWKEMLLMAVGEQFSEALQKGMSVVIHPSYFSPPAHPPTPLYPHHHQTEHLPPKPYFLKRKVQFNPLPNLTPPPPGDDICGLSLSRRHYNDIITIWNRRADNQPSVHGIRDVILAQLSDELKPKESAFYYKAHSAHKDFSTATAVAKKRDGDGDGEMGRARVEEGEAEKVMLREAEEEGVRVEDC
ncbi:MAG: hypothetical protein Q9182_004379 [Xanthomendoza sp. 2 TL-2023]